MVEETLTNAGRFITAPDLTLLACDLPSGAYFVLVLPWSRFLSAPSCL